MPFEERRFYERDKPIGAAAAAVRDLADKAKEMLEQLQSSKWWPWLTLPNRPK
jgi:hypothetical protein